MAARLVVTISAVILSFSMGAEEVKSIINLRLVDGLQRVESYQGCLIQTSQGAHLTFYWHEPMSRHMWENGPIGCSEWLMRDGSIDFWFRDEKFAGARRGTLQLEDIANQGFMPPSEYGVLKGIDLDSITYLLARANFASGGPDLSVLAPLLWSRDALDAFCQGAEIEIEIEPKAVSVFITPTDSFVPVRETVEQFPPFGRRIRVTHEGNVSRLEVRRLLDDVPVLELTKTVVPDNNANVLDAFQPVDLGKLSAAPAPYRMYWQLQGELEQLDRSKAQPESFALLWAKARDVLAGELPKPLDIATAQIYVRAAASAVDLAATTNAVEAFLAVASGSDYERWSVYEAGQAIDLLLDAGVSREQLEALSVEATKTIVANGYMGDEQSTAMLVDDLIASGWPFYVDKLIAALKEQGGDPKLITALRSRLAKSMERPNYVMRAPEALPQEGVVPK